MAELLDNRPDKQNAVCRLMCRDDMLETFSERAVKEPDLMRLVLQARVVALVDVQRQPPAAASSQWFHFIFLQFANSLINSSREHRGRRTVRTRKQYSFITSGFWTRN